MKKLLVLLMLMTLLLTGCGGDTSTTGHHIDESRLYTESEIMDAINVVEKHFRKNFDGCKLVDLSFDAGKCDAATAQAWADNYDAARAIVLYSEFTVGAKGGDGSLNPNSTYRNWNWILTEENGEWVLQTWGY